MAKTIPVALINNQFDYCNLLPHNIAKNTYLNSNVVELFLRMVLESHRFSPSLPLLKQLHWLPFVCRIKLKLVSSTYRTFSTQQPTYLINLLHS